MVGSGLQVQVFTRRDHSLKEKKMDIVNENTFLASHCLGYLVLVRALPKIHDSHQFLD